jgi:WD40 repeat protein
MAVLNTFSERDNDGAPVPALKPLHIPIPCQAFWAVFSPDETRVAVLAQDGKLRTYGLSDGELQRTWSVPSGTANDLWFSNDGKRLLVGGSKGGAVIWNIISGESEWEYRFPESRALFVGFSPDGRLVALTQESGDTHVFDWGSKRELARLAAPVFGGTIVKFSPDGRKIAAVSGETIIRIFDPQTGKLLAENRDLLLETFDMAFSHDSKHLFAGGADGAISIIDAETGKRLRSFPRRSGAAIFVLQVRSDGEAVLAVYNDALDPRNPMPVCVWNVENATVTRIWEPGEIPVGAMWTRENRPLVASTTASTLRIERLS